jgi:hypothetical protein
MHTSLTLVALAGLWTVAAPAAPSWNTDYSRAQEMGSQAKKPLAVFFGAGKNGFEQWSKDGALNRKSLELLTEHYVCVYVDTRAGDGRKLAEQFELQHSHGLVISDRSGEYQVFHYNGRLSNGVLAGTLERFADPTLRVRGTVTDPYVRPVDYRPAYGPAYPPAVPASFSRNC